MRRDLFRVAQVVLGFYSPGWVAATAAKLGLHAGMGWPRHRLSWLDRREMRNAGLGHLLAQHPKRSVWS